MSSCIHVEYSPKEIWPIWISIDDIDSTCRLEEARDPRQKLANAMADVDRHMELAKALPQTEY